MKNAIEAIFQELQAKDVSFDKIRPELKKIILVNLKGRNPDKILKKIQDISLDIVSIGFNKEELFTGNIDSKLIRETAKKYGFDSQTDDKKRTNDKNSYLLLIKNKASELLPWSTRISWGLNFLIIANWEILATLSFPK